MISAHSVAVFGLPARAARRSTRTGWATARIARGSVSSSWSCRFFLKDIFRKKPFTLLTVLQTCTSCAHPGRRDGRLGASPSRALRTDQEPQVKGARFGEQPGLRLGWLADGVRVLRAGHTGRF